jgi:hypothetical protein
MAGFKIDKKYFIYVLELKDLKYYVGKTSNASSRLTEHIRNIGAGWTKRYKPKKIIKLYRECDAFDEDKYTVMYMAIYGIDNVRGGSFCSTRLPDSEKAVLEKMISSASDRCFKCGESDHFAADCQNDRNDPESLVLRLRDWCDSISTQTDYRYILLDEKSNKKYMIFQGTSDLDPIPDTNDKFASKISKKCNASLFKLSVSSFDFHKKTIESDGYDVIYNSPGVTILFYGSDLKEIKGALKESIKTFLETGECLYTPVSQ